MTNFKKIMTGVITFFVAFFLSFILNEVLPELITALETIFNSTDIQGIMWFLMILIYIGGIILVPALFIINGLRETTPIGEENKIRDIIVAVLIFLITALFVYKGWYLITAIANLSSDGFITALYWVGSIIMWILIQFITPVYMIIKATEN